MSHYYLRSKSKTNMKKWYFEYFIAVYFLSLFYDHPVDGTTIARGIEVTVDGSR